MVSLSYIVLIAVQFVQRIIHVQKWLPYAQHTRRRSLFQVTMYGWVRVVRAIQRQIQDFVLGIFDGMWHMSAKDKQMTALQGTSPYYLIYIMINVWYLYLYLADVYGTCRQLYHTWILWVSKRDLPHWGQNCSSSQVTKNFRYLKWRY